MVVRIPVKHNIIWIFFVFDNRHFNDHRIKAVLFIIRYMMQYIYLYSVLNTEFITSILNLIQICHQVTVVWHDVFCQFWLLMFEVFLFVTNQYFQQGCIKLKQTVCHKLENNLMWMITVNPCPPRMIAKMVKITLQIIDPCRFFLYWSLKNIHIIMNAQAQIMNEQTAFPLPVFV